MSSSCLTSSPRPALDVAIFLAAALALMLVALGGWPGSMCRPANFTVLLPVTLA